MNSEKTTAEIISEKIGKHCCNILEGSRQELSTAYVLFTIDYFLTPAKSAAVHPRKGPPTVCQKIKKNLERSGRSEHRPTGYTGLVKGRYRFATPALLRAAMSRFFF